MNTLVPLRFLVGVTRLMAVYFGLRSLESLGTAVYSYELQQSMTSKYTETLSSVWVVYIPVVAFYFALVISVWFVAPKICQLAVGAARLDQPDEGLEISCNEVMIFLFGTLFVGWGFTRLANDLTPIFQAKAQHIPHELSLANQFGFFMTAILMGFGGLMMARFAEIYCWMKKRRLE